jgi:hypothetical protein
VLIAGKELTWMSDTTNDLERMAISRPVLIIQGIERVAFVRSRNVTMMYSMSPAAPRIGMINWYALPIDSNILVLMALALTCCGEAFSYSKLSICTHSFGVFTDRVLPSKGSLFIRKSLDLISK